jgi:uncharacterized protein YbjT (DUF2867 family)
MILVVGGTGMLGRELVGRLRASGRGVRVMTRRPSLAADLLEIGAEVVAGDLRDGAETRAAVDGCASVVAAAHGFVGPRGISPATVDRDGNARLIDAARAVGAEVLLMSIVGASEDSPVELFRMKGAAENHLRRSGVPGTIVQATYFAELWIRLMRETASKSGRPVVFGRGRSLVNFVSVRDVSALLERVLEDASTRGQTYQLGGPDNLTMTELADLVQRADGRTGHPRHLPLTLLRLAAMTAGHLVPQLGRQARTALWTDAEDRPFTTPGARARFPDIPSTHLLEVLGRSGAAQH